MWKLGGRFPKETTGVLSAFDVFNVESLPADSNSQRSKSRLQSIMYDDMLNCLLMISINGPVPGTEATDLEIQREKTLQSTYKIFLQCKLKRRWRKIHMLMMF